METNRRVSPVVAALLVAVVLLASSSVYLGIMAAQKSTGNTGPNSTVPNVVVTRLPASNGVEGSSQTSTDPPSDSITVTGSSQLSYTPNEALLGVSVVTEAATAAQATSSNAATMVGVIKALNQIGISNSSIQTQGFSLNPDYSSSYGSNSVPDIIGYTVTNSLMVNLTAGSATQLGLTAGQAIDTSVAAGANQVNLQFAATNSLLTQLNDQALRQSVSSATEQAQVIANSLGVSVSGVISAVQGTSSYYEQSYPVVYAKAALDTTTPIMPGTQTVYASVTVVYAIG